MMWQNITPIDDGVTHGLVGVVDTDLGSNTPFEAALGTQFHLLEVFQILFYGVVPSFRSDSIHALLTHL